MSIKAVNNSVFLNRLFARFAASKKKTALAVFLVAVMVVMWVRVLTKDGPQEVSAAVSPDEASYLQSASAKDAQTLRTAVSFVRLPEVKGRNDVLRRDFFVVNNWRNFVSGRGGADTHKTGFTGPQGGADTAGRIAAKLTLEAIEITDVPRAFINDRLLTVGNKLLISDGPDKYECEVVKIEQTEVVIKCGQSEVTLKLFDSM